MSKVKGKVKRKRLSGAKTMTSEHSRRGVADSEAVDRRKPKKAAVLRRDKSSTLRASKKTKAKRNDRSAAKKSIAPRSEVTDDNQLATDSIGKAVGGSRTKAKSSKKKRVEKKRRMRKVKSERLLKPSLVKKKATGKSASKSRQSHASGGPKHRAATPKWKKQTGRCGAKAKLALPPLSAVTDGGEVYMSDDAFGIDSSDLSKSTKKRKKKKILKGKGTAKKSFVMRVGESLVGMLQNDDVAVDYERVEAIAERYPAEMDTRDKMKNNALHLAARRKDSRLLAIVLRKAGQRHLAALNSLKESPLLVAVCTAGDLQCTRLLLESRHLSDLNAVNLNGRTALIHAAVHNLDAIALLLLKQRPAPDLEMRDKGKKTALYWALNRGNVQIAAALLASGASFKVTDTSGRSAVDVAKGDCVHLLKDESAYGPMKVSKKKKEVSKKAVVKKRKKPKR